MSDTSDERVIGYAKWNESEAKSLRLHCADSPSMPELAEMHEETAATLRMLMAERNQLREAAAVVNSVCGKNNCNCPTASCALAVKQ
jgi:hypothetical protein